MSCALRAAAGRGGKELNTEKRKKSAQTRAKKNEKNKKKKRAHVWGHEHDPREMCGVGAGAERADKDAMCGVWGAGRGRRERVLHCGRGRAREQGAGAR